MSRVIALCFMSLGEEDPWYKRAQASSHKGEGTALWLPAQNWSRKPLRFRLTQAKCVANLSSLFSCWDQIYLGHRIFRVISKNANRSVHRGCSSWLDVWSSALIEQSLDFSHKFSVCLNAAKPDLVRAHCTAIFSIMQKEIWFLFCVKSWVRG